MDTCSIIETFNSVDKIQWCVHTYATSLVVLLDGTIYFSIFYKIKFRDFFLNFDVRYSWEFKELRAW